tara:strand:- start:20926 stop:21264 length:339 start_codon:yes stop_codon:yes gene_type:complete
MFNSKFVFSTTIFISFLILISFIKNESRILEKKILSLNSKILLKEKNLSETQLDFFYLTTPYEIEKKLKVEDIKKFEPIHHSKIFNGIHNFINEEKKLSNLKKLDEKKTRKK